MPVPRRHRPSTSPLSRRSASVSRPSSKGGRRWSTASVRWRLRRPCRCSSSWRVPPCWGERLMQIAALLGESFLQTLTDVAPIALVIASFQALAFRTAPPRLGRILIGLAAIVLGISMFRAGLGLSLIPMGDRLAERLAHRVAEPEYSTLLNASWLVMFAASLGFAATMIEPTLTGIADRVRELTGGGLEPLSFRLVIALGVAIGLALGTIRILLG